MSSVAPHGASGAASKFLVSYYTYFTAGWYTEFDGGWGSESGRVGVRKGAKACHLPVWTNYFKITHLYTTLMLDTQVETHNMVSKRYIIVTMAFIHAIQFLS